MATITINVPAGDASEAVNYVLEVARQLAGGNTSGHHDRDTHWGSDIEP